MLDPAILGRAAAALLADGRTRERLGRVLVALVSPLLVLAALLCALASGTAEHNTAAVEGSFSGTALSVQFPAEYRGEVEAMQRAFTLLEEEIAAAEVQMEDGDRLDAIRVTLYGHCSRLLARVGQAVEAGDVVALSGSTGRSTGPHLHFEVRVSGERTDPRGYLP